MILYLVRHGYASNGYPDEQRGLTKGGVSTLKKSIRVWQNYIPNLDFIITSPLLRAVRTAEIINSELNFGCRLFRDNLLVPGCGIDDLQTVVNPLEAESIMIVGHLPDLANHVSSLISNSGIRIQFSPGTIASVSFKGPIKLSEGVLNFFIPPVI